MTPATQPTPRRPRLRSAALTLTLGLCAGLSATTNAGAAAVCPAGAAFSPRTATVLVYKATAGSEGPTICNRSTGRVTEELDEASEGENAIPQSARRVLAAGRFALIDYVAENSADVDSCLKYMSCDPTMPLPYYRYSLLRRVDSSTGQRDAYGMPFWSGPGPEPKLTKRVALAATGAVAWTDATGAHLLDGPIGADEPPRLVGGSSDRIAFHGRTLVVRSEAGAVRRFSVRPAAAPPVAPDGCAVPERATGVLVTPFWVAWESRGAQLAVCDRAAGRRHLVSRTDATDPGAHAAGRYAAARVPRDDVGLADIVLFGPGGRVLSRTVLDVPPDHVAKAEAFYAVSSCGDVARVQPGLRVVLDEGQSRRTHRRFVLPPTTPEIPAVSFAGRALRVNGRVIAHGQARCPGAAPQRHHPPRRCFPRPMIKRPFGPPLKGRSKHPHIVCPQVGVVRG